MTRLFFKGERKMDAVITHGERLKEIPVPGPDRYDIEEEIESSPEDTNHQTSAFMVAVD